MKEYNNVFYFANINSIGGVETFFYYLSKVHKDMVVYYSNGDLKQIERLAKNIEVHKYNGEKIKCNRFFINYNLNIIDNVIANEYIQIIHADYKALGKRPNIHKKITKYIGVSKVACESFKELTGIECELMYNPVIPDSSEKCLLLVSATRLTEEKGKDNMIALGNKLNVLGRPWLWLIFTNDTNVIRNDNIIYMSPRLDISSYLEKADYVVQLSDTESFGLTVNESLVLGTPVVVMELPIWKELGIKNGEHGYIIDDINKFDCSLLYKDLGTIKYECPKDKWGKYIGDKSDYDGLENVKVEILETIDDIKTGARYKKGDIVEFPRWRVGRMLDDNVVKVVVDK